MGTEKTAVIIGAGIGGIATSIYLARQGYKVSVYEKNSSPGGRCGQIIRDGHRFDLGATIYLMPEIYKQAFESLGIDLKDNFKTTPLSTLYKIYFEDGIQIAFTSDKEKLKEQLENIEKGSFEKSQHLIQKGYTLFQLASNSLLGRNFYRLFDFITVKNALLLVKLKTYLPHMLYIRHFFSNEHLQKAFTFQNIYVGQNPYQAPALFSMLPAAELTEGSLFPVGGMFSVTRKLLNAAEDLGVRFIYDMPVSKIKTDGKRATGIILQNGSTIRASVIVANADLPYVYRELLPDKSISKRIGKLKYSCSAIVLHWGLDKMYPELGHHSVFLSASYRANLKMIFQKHSLSGNPSFYVHAPVRSDNTAAPPGHDTLTVIIPAGHLNDADDHNWTELKNTARAISMGILISVVMGMILTSPMSSAAIAIMLNLTGIAAGAATIGCTVQMVGFAVASYRENGVNGLFAQGIGTAKLQGPNIVKKPLIWLPTIVTSAILGPISTNLFRILGKTDLYHASGLISNAKGAGMGSCGFVGQMMTFSEMGFTVWPYVLLLHFILPALLTWAFTEYMRKKGWIKLGDLKLDL